MVGNFHQLGKHNRINNSWPRGESPESHKVKGSCPICLWWQPPCPQKGTPHPWTMQVSLGSWKGTCKWWNKSHHFRSKWWLYFSIFPKFSLVRVCSFYNEIYINNTKNRCKRGKFTRSVEMGELSPFKGAEFLAFYNRIILPYKS